MRGARTIHRGEEGWPRAVDLLPDAPGILRVRGELPAAGARRVAVVGSRSAGAAGLDQAFRVGAVLARAGAWVVSGGAAGIDAAAHLGCLEAGGRTLVVLGGGLDHLYPAANRGLFARVVESGGGLLSEVADDQGAAIWSFPKRNRIVAALGEATVVVRAGARSGALLTAGHARRLGQPVWVAEAVEGDDGEGLRGLLATGANGFRSADELLRGIGLSPRGEDEQIPAVAGELGGEAATLLAALDGEPRGTDEVAARAGMGAGAVLAGLMELELLGLVERRPGRGYARREIGSRGA
jgi:DNA processing protein